MKCPYTTACEQCGLQNSENCNTCKEISKLADCKNVDTSGMSLTIECKDCDWYNNGVRPTGAIRLF